MSVRAGVAVPGTVRLRPVPEEIVSVYPQFRGYEFAMVRDEVVIVDPKTREVVEVVGRGNAARAEPRRHFSRTQDELIRKSVRTERHVDVTIDEAPEARVPDSVELETLPNTVVSEIPEARSYRYFVDRNEHIVLVDPDSHEVVDVIQ